MQNKTNPQILANPISQSLNIGLDARYVQPGFPGIGRYVYSLAGALAALLEAAEPSSKLNLVFNPALTDKRHDLNLLQQTYPQTLHLIPSTTKPISPNEQWQLPVLARSRRFSLWHAPYYIRPYIMPLPTVLTAYDVISARLPNSLPSRKARLAFEVTTRLAFLTSRRILVISQAAADDILKLYHVKPEKIKVVPLGFEPQFRPVSPDEQSVFRADLNLPSSYLLYVGINKPHKNLARLIEAFKEFKERTHAETVLILAGKEDPRYSADLHALAARLGLDHPKGVRFWGEVAETDLPKLYAAADFLVMPSLYEGFGLPVLEAMASGCPVASANNSSLPEVGGDAALYFQAEQTHEIAAAIQRLSENPALRAELREKGLKQATLFSWQRAAESTLEVYHSIFLTKN